jgi:hypothetical protein
MRILQFKIIMITILFGTLNAQTIYVDINRGKDKNEGTKEFPVRTIEKAAELVNNNNLKGPGNIKIEPGVYNLTAKIVFNNDKFIEQERLIIQADVLPDDTSWSPEKMPVIVSTSGSSENFGFDCSLGFDIEVSHVTIRGLKFLGNPNPDVYYYYPIGRSGKNLTDLEVAQCVFVGEKDAIPVQSGILAHGNQIKVTHCVYYNCRNSVVFYFANEDRNIERYGSEMSYCIVYGSYESGIWTASPDKDFKFFNNVITNCKYAWVHNIDNKTNYRIENCIITNNENYITSLDGKVWEFSPSDINYSEKNVIKEGVIILQKKTEDGFVMPKDYLHIVKGNLGDNLNSGIFLINRN